MKKPTLMAGFLRRMMFVLAAVSPPHFLPEFAPSGRHDDDNA
jgi:hypothetical protein